MSLGCAAGCGDCCDPVHLSPDQRDHFDRWRERVEDVWAGDQPEPGGSMPFMLVHWHELEHKPTGTTYRCDRFDPDTRMCTAHEDRPPVCSNFPWYGDPPDPSVFGGSLGRCSYMLDLPPDQRPAGSRPLIPVEVVSPRP